MHLLTVCRFLCSHGCLYCCRCKALAWLVYIFRVSLVDPETHSPWVVTVILRMFYLGNLGLSRSKYASGRIDIHPIWQIWQFRGGVFISFFILNWFLYIGVVNYDSMIVLCSCGIHKRFCLWCLSVWEIRIIYPNFQTSGYQWLKWCSFLRQGCRYWWYQRDNASGRIFDVKWCRCLWCKGAVEYFYKGMVWYLEFPREGFRNNIFVTLMCCEFRDFLLLTRVKLSQTATSLCDSAFAGSHDTLWIHPIALKLSVNENMCNPFPSCRIVIYIDIAGARNSNKFSVSLHAILMDLSIAMLSRYRCSLQCYILMNLTVLLPLFWRRLCCCVGPPLWWHIGEN